MALSPIEYFPGAYVLYVIARATDPSVGRIRHFLGKVTTCWKKGSMASAERVMAAPRAASDLPLIRSSKRKDPQGPLEALSNSLEFNHEVSVVRQGKENKR